MVPAMKILPRKTSLACLLALVAFAPSGFSWEVNLQTVGSDPFCSSFTGFGIYCSRDPGPSWRVFAAQDSCGNQNLFLIDEKKGELLAQHALEPGEELEEVVSVTPSEITMRVNASNTAALLAQFQTYLSQNPAPDVIEAQVVTASSYFPELQFGTPSRAAAFDRWYEQVYEGSSTEPSEILRTYRIDKAGKALRVVAQRVFKESDAEQPVDDGNEAPSDRRASRTFFTAEVSADGYTLKLRNYAYKTAERVGLQ
jgi:hypothetical protein